MLKVKSKYFYLIVILTSVFGIFLISNTIIYKSSLDNANYNSDGLDDLRSSDPDITITTPENTTYTTPMSGYYPATYGFENDAGGGPPEEWILIEDGGSVDIQNTLDEHNKVLRFYDTSTTYGVNAHNEFKNQTTGEVEWWFKKTSGSTACYFIFHGGTEYSETTRAIEMNIDAGDNGAFGVRDGVPYIYDYSYSDNTWYHIRVQFDCINHNFTVYINGVPIFLNASFFNNMDEINLMEIGTNSFRVGTFYADAIAYSWDPDYNIGDNLNAGLLLSFDTTFTPDWLGYSLDGQLNQTILGNTAFPFPNQEGIHTVQVFGNDTLGAKFESDLRYFFTKMLNIITPENITYMAPMSGYYPGTFGFENDEDGTVPEGWVDNSQSGCAGEIVSEKLGHQKVLHLDDDSGNKAYLDTNFLNQSYGTFEMWVLSEDCTDGIKIRGIDRIGNVQLYRFGIGQDKWVYYDGVSYLPSTNLDGVYDPLDNTWYHLKILFRCNGAPSYQGLGENKFKVIIDGMYESEEINFWNVKNNMNGLTLTTSAVDTNDEWVDSIGYSWDSNYNIGDNRYEGLLLSFEKSTKLDWIGYSLDGQLNNTILGNSTFPYPSIEGLHMIQVFGNNSLGTIFESEIRYFTIKMLNVITPENKTYYKPMSGYYPATYGFENDRVGDNPNEWIVDENQGTVQVVSEIDNHKNIVELHDTDPSSGDGVQLNQTLNNLISGTIELWFRTSDASKDCYINIMDGTTHSNEVALYIYSGAWQYYDTSFHTIISASSNRWYHIRIEFNCASNWHLWIDGDQKDSGGYSFKGSPVLMDRIVIRTRGTDSDYYLYVDSIGYSWDLNYNVGDNENEGLLLSFDINVIPEWIGYSLDNQLNKTILGNTTFPYPNLNEIHTIQVFGNNSIGTIYESDVRYFTVNTSYYLNIITPENITYTEPMSGYYPSTYGFENDEIGWDPMGWTVDESGGPIQVLSEVDGHKNVVEIQDNDGTFRSQAYQTFTSPQSSGEIEFWWRLEAGDHHNVRVRSGTIDGTSEAILIRARATTMEYQYYDGSLWHAICNYQDLTWHHIRLKFDLAQGWDMWVDDDLKSSGNYEYTFANSLTTVDNLRFDTGTFMQKDQWFDAVGYSWDPNYSIGDNLNEGLLLSFDTIFTPHWLGYSLDGNNNITIIGNTTLPRLDNGLHSIQLFGNNSLGYFYTSDIRYFTLNIPIVPPQISINFPQAGDFYGYYAPYFEVTITSLYLDTKWYTLDNGITKTIFEDLSGTINQSDWENYGYGPITIKFYANDTFGQENYAKININKDLSSPNTTLLFTPYSGLNVVTDLTVFYLIADDHFESGVSIIRYKINDSSWITYSGAFRLSGFSPGDYLITYQAVDLVGNMESEQTKLVNLYDAPDRISEIPVLLTLSIILGASIGIAIFIFIASILHDRKKSKIFIDEKKKRIDKITKDS